MKTIQTLITAFLLLFLLNKLDAQIKFEKTFGTTGDNFANDVQLTNDGGYIVAGTGNFAGGTGDILLLKTNAGGFLLWSRVIGGPGIENGNSVFQTSDNGYIIAGSTTSFGAGGSDAYLVKTDASGNVMWSKTYGTTNNDAAYGIVQTADGGYVFSGTENQQGLNGNAHLVKVDANGNVLWSKTFGSNLRKNFAYSLLQTSDHGFIIGGWENLNLGINDDYCLIKTDSNGTIQWYKSYGGVNIDQNYSVQETTDGGFIIAGMTVSSSVFDVNVVKTDGSGNLQWTKSFGGTGEDDVYGITTTHDGGYVICGSTSSFGLNHAAYILKIDGSGNLLWSKTMTGNGWDGFFAIRTASDGGFILAGVKGETYGVSGSLYLVKTDANGNTGCNGSVTSSAYTPSILVGNLIASGTSTQLVSNVSSANSPGPSVIDVCVTCTPPAATITPLGNLDICQTGSVGLQANSGAGFSYQWTKGNTIITGATNQVYTAVATGSYKVIVTKKSGCSKLSKAVKVTSSCRAEFALNENSSGELYCYPNPSKGSFRIGLNLPSDFTSNATLQITNLLGQTVYSNNVVIATGNLNENVNANLMEGIYILKLIVQNKTYSQKIVIQR